MFLLQASASGIFPSIKYEGPISMYIMYRNNVVYPHNFSDVPEPFNVKARGRQGTTSLDLTIPTEIKRKYGISEGDVFIVEVDQDGDQLSLSYNRIYKA
jgi:hypothetical protein